MSEKTEVFVAVEYDGSKWVSFEDFTRLKAERDGECVWSQAEDMKAHYYFDTQCNKSFCRDWVDSGPMEEFTYCPYCGLKIKNKQPEEQGE